MSKSKTLIYAYNLDGHPTGTAYADLKPDGTIMIPSGWTSTAPPQEMAGYDIVWDGTGWSYKQEEQKAEPASVTQPAEDASQQEIEELQSYLDETDYKVIKCMELGLDLDAEYPGVRTSRQNARIRIRALRDNANR